MITIEEIKKLPEPIKKEVLDYAEYLITEHRIGNSKSRSSRWVDVSSRGRSKNQTTPETVIKLREEERW